MKKKDYTSFRILAFCLFSFTSVLVYLCLADLSVILGSLEKSLDLCYLLAKHNCDLSTYQVDDLSLFKKDLQSLILSIIAVKIGWRLFYYHVIFPYFFLSYFFLFFPAKLFLFIFCFFLFLYYKKM